MEDRVISLVEHRELALESNVTSQRGYVSSSIEVVMQLYKERSINTYKSYMRAYKEFFKLVLNKDMKFVLWREFLSINYEGILKYREKLRANGNSNSTVNQKVAALSTLYGELHKINRDVDVVAVSLKPLPEREAEANSYGSLTETEVSSLIDYCNNLGARRKPLEKALFFKTAYITAIRQGALLQMTWDNIKPIIREGNTLGWTIELEDKGKTTTTPITNDFYNELLELKGEDSRVFPTTRKTLSKVLREYCEHVGIDHEERNIVLHSLKKASIDKVYHETRDITRTARHGHHSGIEMVYQTYEGRNNDLLDSPSYVVFDDNNIEEVVGELNNHSKEDLIAAIMSSGDSLAREVLSNLES